jgi:hypothetical protein
MIVCAESREFMSAAEPSVKIDPLKAIAGMVAELKLDVG